MVVIRTRVGDVELAADEEGTPGDPAVLLFHGGGQTRHSWKHAAASLGNRGFLARSYDLRGHGESDWSPDGLYGNDTFSGDVRALALGLGAPPALVGASLGGISSLLAIAEADDPLAVASALLLVDVAPKLEDDGVTRIGQFMLSGLDGFASLDEVADAIAGYNPNRPRPTDLSGLRKNVRQRADGRWVWHWDPRFLAPRPVDGLPDDGRRYTHEERLSEAARRITVPTLLVRGRQSDVLSEAGARHLLELIPHAEYVDVQGAGHMVAGDRNDWFNDAVIDFLERHRPPRG